MYRSFVIPLHARVKTELSQLFASLEVGPLHPQDLVLDHPYHMIGLSPDQALILREGATGLLRKIGKELSQPALSGRGLSLEGAESLLIQACREFHQRGPEAALAWLTDELEKPERTWVVIEPAKIHFKGEPVRVGRCDLYQTVPPSHADEVFVKHFASKFKNSVIVATPTATDEHSARRLAHEYIEESRAIVVMADGEHHGVDSRTPHLIGHPGTPLAAIRGKSDWLYLEHVQDRDGRLYPEFSALSAAATKPEHEREDWERRVLAAARWNAIAVTTGWPSEALGASMIALECLFVRSRRVKRKGKAIAGAVSKRWEFRSDQEDWLENLYSSRNDVIHEGRHFIQEVDVYDLLAILARALHWGAWHLHDMHRSDGKICSTFDEAMAPHD